MEFHLLCELVTRQQLFVLLPYVSPLFSDGIQYDPSPRDLVVHRLAIRGADDRKDLQELV